MGNGFDFKIPLHYLFHSSEMGTRLTDTVAAIYNTNRLHSTAHAPCPAGFFSFSVPSRASATLMTVLHARLPWEGAGGPMAADWPWVGPGYVSVVLVNTPSRFILDTALHLPHKRAPPSHLFTLGWHSWTQQCIASLVFASHLFSPLFTCFRRATAIRNIHAAVAASRIGYAVFSSY
jgi:hypothetical protein